MHKGRFGGKEKGCWISVWDWNSPKLLPRSSRSNPLRPDPEKNLGNSWDGWIDCICAVPKHGSTWTGWPRSTPCLQREVAQGWLSCTLSIAARKGSVGLICQAGVPRHNPVMPGDGKMVSGSPDVKLKAKKHFGRVSAAWT